MSVSAKTSKALVAALSLSSLGMGCQPCDADACTDFLRVIVREPDASALLDGVYTIEIVTDAAQYEGSCTISGAGRNAACEGLDSVFSLPKFDSPDNPHEQMWIDFPDRSMSDAGEAMLPQEVQLTITYMGGVVLADTLTPQYEVEDATCHPECVNDLIELTLSR
jgi:hypothetical protein